MTLHCQEFELFPYGLTSIFLECYGGSFRLSMVALKGSSSTWIRGARRNCLHSRTNVASRHKFTGGARPRSFRRWNRNGTFRSKRLRLDCGCPVRRLQGGQRNNLYSLDPVSRPAEAPSSRRDMTVFSPPTAPSLSSRSSHKCVTVSPRAFGSFLIRSFVRLLSPRPRH